MEQVMDVIKIIIESAPAIVAALGLTVAAASAWVLVTPSPRDDEVVNKIRAFIERLSVFFPTEGIKARDVVDDELDE